VRHLARPVDGNWRDEHTAAVRGFLALTVVLLAAIGVGVGLVAATGTSSGPAPSAVVLTAASRTIGDGSAHLRLVVTTSGLPDGVHVGATGTGQIDLATGAMELAFTYSGSPGFDGLTAHELYTGDRLYLWIPQVAKVLPGKAWVELPVGKLPSTPAGAGNDPAGMLHVLEQQGAEVTSLGASSLDGLATEGYAVKLDTAAMRARIERASLPPAIRQAALEYVRQGGHVDLDVWIDRSNQLRRITEQVSLPFPAVPDAAATVTVDFVDFGAPVSIPSPVPSQVASFKQYQSALSGAPSLLAPASHL
jgi:hypothetical protein